MTTAVFLFENGNIVKSKSMGLEGTITSRSESLYGCNRYYVQPQIGADGKVPDGWWVDEGDIKFIAVGLAHEAKEAAQKPAEKRGGPASTVK